MRRQFTKFKFGVVTLSVILFLSGCTGFLRRSNGNAEGFAGAKPIPGTYYQVHSQAACANSADAISGHVGVIEVSESGSATYRGACETTPREIAESELTVSQYGHESFPGGPMLVYQDRIADALPTMPTIHFSGRSTRAWYSQRIGADYYDVILRAVGAVESPLSVVAHLFITKREPTGKKTTRLAAEIPVSVLSPDANRQVATGAGFVLNMHKMDGQMLATLSATVEGAAIQLPALTGYNTYFSPPPRARPNVLLAAGSLYSCGVYEGAAYCWGANGSGQCGVGSQNDQPTPHPVDSLSSGVASLSAGNTHTCAVKNSLAYCWGSNVAGELGLGTTGGMQLSPMVVASLTPVTAVTAGGGHTCALSNKKVYCWGLNSNGQLGDATNLSKSSPVAVAGITEEVASITAGYEHTCAVTVGGEAHCWGGNGGGQVGVGSATPHYTTPQKIPGVRFSSLSAGGWGTCGVTDVGKVRCWGDNINSEVSGDGLGTTKIDSPYELPMISGPVTKITAGKFFRCAIQGGQPMCWGMNNSGQLGVGNDVGPRAVGGVLGLSQVFEISAGSEHALAYSLGLASSWGANASGALGDGTTFPRFQPGPFSFP